MNHSRPKNLNLMTIRFPIPAIVSILHRMTGAFLFLLIPFALWALQLSLTPEGFDYLSVWMGNVFVKGLVWLLFVPLCFHLIAGIRHLLSDVHIGDSKVMGRKMAILTFVVSAVIIILAGIWLW